MNTRVLLGSSAVVMGAAGIAATFLPQELLDLLGITPGGMLPVVIQLLGALWFAFAMMNWAAKGNPIGGIYGRPVALGNLTHFVVGALALIKAMLNGSSNTVLVALAVVYTAFALAFGIVFVHGPVPARSSR